MSTYDKPESRGIGDALRKMFRVLIFRATKEELLALNKWDLAVGIFCTWLVGMGRYWDNDRAVLLQHLGVGSVVYVFVLATFLWLIIWTVHPDNWSWRRLLIYITLTSPPAILYAIPVQKFFDDPTLVMANTVNVWFLSVVALWRVALFVHYLVQVAGFGRVSAVTVTLCPMMLLIAALAALNLENAVFEVMAGLPPPPTPNDDSYFMLILITFLSAYGFIPVLIVCIAIGVNRWKKDSVNEKAAALSDFESETDGSKTDE